jgi:hypothetical protein
MMQHCQAERSEARLILRFAAKKLSKTERQALSFFAADVPLRTTAWIMGMCAAGVLCSQRAALRKLRVRLHRLGFTSTTDLLSD